MSQKIVFIPQKAREKVHVLSSLKRGYRPPPPAMQAPPPPGMRSRKFPKQKRTAVSERDFGLSSNSISMGEFSVGVSERKRGFTVSKSGTRVTRESIPVSYPEYHAPPPPGKKVKKRYKKRGVQIPSTISYSKTPTLANTPRTPVAPSPSNYSQIEGEIGFFDPGTPQPVSSFNSYSLSRKKSLFREDTDTAWDASDLKEHYSEMKQELERLSNVPSNRSSNRSSIRKHIDNELVIN